MPAASTAIASSSVGVHSFSSRSIKYLVRSCASRRMRQD